MDFKIHLYTYIFFLMHVMDSIEGRDDGHVHKLRPENPRFLEPGHKSKSKSEGARPKEIFRIMILPSKLQSIEQSEFPSFSPVLKFNHLRTSMNEERDILKSTNDFHRSKGMVFKSYLKRMNLNGNMTPISRSTSMIGYLGDTSKVEQQLTMASGLVSEENIIPGSLNGKSYPSQKADRLDSLIRKIIASKYNYLGRDQALLDRGSKLRYSVQGNEKNLDLNFHKNLVVVPQKKIDNFSGILPRSHSHLEHRAENTPRSFDGILNFGKVRSRGLLERLPRFLGHVNVAVNKGRNKRASIDLTNLLPPITLEIGRFVPKSDNSGSTEENAENERSGLNMDETLSKRSTEKHSRLLGSVDVTMNKGRAERASIDLNNVLPPVSLEIGRSAPKSANSGSNDKEEMGRTRRASVDLSGILPTTNLQVGRSERSVPDSGQNRFSPLLILFSDTKLDRTSADDPYLHSMISYFLKKLVKCDDLTDEDLDSSR